MAPTCFSASVLALPSTRAVSYAATACDASSSTMSSSKMCPDAAAASRILAFQFTIESSRVANSSNAIQGHEEPLPNLALLRQNLAACTGQSIEAPAANAGPFNPSAFDQPSVLKAIQGGVQRSNVEIDRAFGSLFD